MLPKFHVRNLRSSSQPSKSRDSLVLISAPTYDTTISDHPAAALKYRDEDGDDITLGSSHELIDKLEEPITQPSARSSRRRKDRMSIAMLLSEVQQNPDAVNYHTFDIEEREEIQNLWQQIQQRNKTPPPHSNSPEIEHPAGGNLAIVDQPSRYPIDSPSVTKTVDGSDRRNISHRRLHDPAVVESNMRKHKNTSNKLAAAYNRCKIDIWTPIAAEVGISWEEAESLHWALGKDWMNRRTAKLNASRTDSFEDLETVNNIDGDLHENRNKKTQDLAKSTDVQKFEDYRRHHFNATVPPRLRNTVPASQMATKFAVGKPPYAGVAKLTLPKGTSASTSAAPLTHLTTEGKRQAQAAGDILRSRTTPSRHRKVATITTDHTNHQNRWASYKSPNTAFSPQMSTPPSQGCSVPTLIPEGRRQAQVAGDKLRSRTNPIRHSRTTRSGSLEHGVSKNRWASYVAPRVARFEERTHTSANLEDKGQPRDADTAEQEKQTSLLEVFEAELAKSFLNSDDATGEGQVPEPAVIDIPSPRSGSSSPAPDSTQTCTPTQVAPPPLQSRALLQGLALINDFVQGISSAGGAQEFSNLVDHGIQSATGAIEALARGVPRSIHDVLGYKGQSGAVQREATIKGIDDALNGLQNLVSNVATGLSGPGGSVLSDKLGADKTKIMRDEPDATNPDAMPIEVLSRIATEALDYISSVLSHTLPSAGAQHTPPFAADGSMTVANSLDFCQASSPQFLSDIQPAEQMQANDDPSIARESTMYAPRYHEPGPIHLPHDTPTQIDLGSPTDGFINSDHLCQSRSTVSLDSHAMSPPPAATRFPTLAQFEVQNFTAASPFPPLPSMEPLVPQRRSAHTVINMVDTQTPETSDVPYQSSEASQPRISNIDHAIKQRLADEGIDPACLTDNQLIAFAKQNPATQWTLIRAYAQNMATNQRRQRSSQDFQFEPMLDEEHDSKILLKTRQEPMPSDFASPMRQVGTPATLQVPITTRPNSPKTNEQRDYEMQLLHLEQQSKKRWLMALEEQKKCSEGQYGTPTFAKQQLEVEQHNEERTGLAIPDQDGLYGSPNLSGTISHTHISEDQCDNAIAADTSGLSREHENQGSLIFPSLSPAARLAEPFDPLDVEPSAQPQLTKAIRRTATFAGTDSGHNARRRRPYSEAFDGFGRVPWESFEGATDQENRMSPARRREQATRSYDRYQRRQEKLRRGATLHKSKSTLPIRRYDDEHEDDSSVNKIEFCVRQLRNLGFGGGEGGSGDRLLVYAQAAEGDLVDAIDMIDEEQRAYIDL